MTSFSSVFGVGTTLPSNVGYLALNPTGDVTLAWPKETAPSPNLLATIIDVNAGALAVNLVLDDATQGSTGSEFLFNNLGAANVAIKNNAGATVLVLAPGLAWVVYLADNTTAAGVWRTFQLGSFLSQANAASLAGTGLVAIGNTLAGDMPPLSFSASGTNFGITDRARFYRWTSGVGNCNLPSTAAVPLGWFMGLRNDGSGALTINAAGGNTINGSATLVLQPGDSCTIIAAAANIMDTVGLGKSTSFGFDFTSINVAGTGTYTLSGAELNRISYRLTGLLTGDRTIIVPATVQQYWVTNSTTGAFNLYVKTLAQVAPGVQVVQNQATILYSDSNNVVPGDTLNLSLPVSIAQGGTNATTAAGARANLGSTGVGDAVFTAASAAAARAALDAASLTQINTFMGVNTFTGVPQNFNSSTAGAGQETEIALLRNKGAGVTGDGLQFIAFRGMSDASVNRGYAAIGAYILQANNGNEYGGLEIQTLYGGANATRWIFGGGMCSNNATGFDKGPDTINAKNYFVDGGALGRLVRTTVFGTPGTSTFTPHPLALNYEAEVLGSGGGGGGCALTGAGQGAAGGGGCGGGWGIKQGLISAISGATVTVAAGGTAGAVGGNGGNGSTSSIGAVHSATGGAGGLAGTAGAVGTVVAAQSGGNSSTGDVTQAGGDGGSTGIFSTVVAQGGFGGSSRYSPGTTTDLLATGDTGYSPSGSAFGGGGSGAANAASQGAGHVGGPGGGGLVIIREYA